MHDDKYIIALKKYIKVLEHECKFLRLFVDQQRKICLDQEKLTFHVLDSYTEQSKSFKLQFMDDDEKEINDDEKLVNQLFNLFTQEKK